MQINNRILTYCGKHVFHITYQYKYILINVHAVIMNIPLTKYVIINIKQLRFNTSLLSG